MDSLEIKETIEDYEKLRQRCAEVANRWLKIRNTGYTTGWYGITIHSATDTFSFTATPSCSGMTVNETLPLKYLWDDATLEEDAKLAYETDREENLKRQKEIEKLQSNPDVIRFQELQRIKTNYYPNQLYGIQVDIPFTSSPPVFSQHHYRT